MLVGILLINIGTPRSYQLEDVSSYLAEFLMDKEIISLPWFLRYLLVNKVIIPRRAKVSSKKYESIWTEQGSPLQVHSISLQNKLEKRLEPSRYLVRMAMRYGSPSIRQVLNEFKENGIKKVLVLPLYPQYARATTESSWQKTFEEAAKIKEKFAHNFDFQLLPEFFNQEDFLEAQVNLLREYKANDYFYLFSFHGLPLSQILRTKGCHVERQRQGDQENQGEQVQGAWPCCHSQNKSTNLAVTPLSFAEPLAAHLAEPLTTPLKVAGSKCYRAQCLWTAQELARRLELPSNRWTYSFQSRLQLESSKSKSSVSGSNGYGFKGFNEWLMPYTNKVISELPSKNIKNLLVFSPSFVTDCLETLEELGLEGKNHFMKAGGESYLLAPSLNDSEALVRYLEKLVRAQKIEL